MKSQSQHRLKEIDFGGRCNKVSLQRDVHAKRGIICSHILRFTTRELHEKDLEARINYIQSQQKIGYDAVFQRIREALGYSTAPFLGSPTICLGYWQYLCTLWILDKSYVCFGLKVFQYYFKYYI